MIVRTPQIDQHVALRLVVTDTLNEAAARRLCAGKRLQVDSAAVLNVDRFRAGIRRHQHDKHCDQSDRWSNCILTHNSKLRSPGLLERI